MIPTLILATSGGYLNGWLAAALVSLLIFLGFLSGFVRARQSRAWPTVPGRVVESKIEKNSRTNMDSHRPDISYQPLVRYRYEVNGVTLESKQIAIGGFASSESYAAGIIAKYPAGSRVTVHHHATRSDLAVLEPGGSIFPLIGTLLAAAVLIFIGLTWVKVSQHPDKSPWGQNRIAP